MNKKINKKKNINLYQKKYFSKSFPKRIVIIVFGVLFSALFSWYGIIQPYLEIKTLQSDVLNEKSNLEIVLAQRENYENVEEEYIRYSKDYLSSKERQIVSRKVVFEKIDEYLLKDCNVEKLQLTDNKLVTTLVGATLAKSSDVIDRMQNDADGVIEYATTKNAVRETGGRLASVDMTIVFRGNNYEVVSFEE